MEQPFLPIRVRLCQQMDLKVSISLVHCTIYTLQVSIDHSLTVCCLSRLVLQALTKNKRRRGSKESLFPPVGDPSKLAQYPLPGQLNAALLDNNNINFLYQQPQFIPIIEHLIQQEQQQQSSLFSQRSFDASPMEIESFDSDKASRRVSPSQFYTLQALPKGLTFQRR